MRNANKVMAGLLAAVLTAPVSCLWAQTNAPDVAPASSPQVTQPEQGGVNWKGVGIGAGTVASNILYIPAKLVYGILGGIGGGAAYALTAGNEQVANTIWRSSLGGDYVVTPGMLTGKQRLHFNGPTATAPADGSSASSGEAASASSYAAASTAPAPGVAPASHAIDSGAGPVNNNSKPTVSNVKTAPIDTSIE